MTPEEKKNWLSLQIQTHIALARKEAAFRRVSVSDIIRSWKPK